MRILLLCLLCCWGAAAERVFTLDDRDPIKTSILPGSIVLQVDHPEVEQVHIAVSRIRSVVVDRLGTTRIHLQRCMDDDIFTYRLRRNIFDDPKLLGLLNAAAGRPGLKQDEKLDRKPVDGPYLLAASPLHGYLYIRKSSHPEEDIHVSIMQLGRVQVDRFGHTTVNLKKEFGRPVEQFSVRAHAQSAETVLALLAAIKSPAAH